MPDTAEQRNDDAWADAKAAFDEVSNGPAEAPEVAADPEVETAVEKEAHAKDENRNTDGTFRKKKSDEPEVKEAKPAKEARAPEIKEPKLEQPVEPRKDITPGFKEVEPVQAVGNPPPGWSVRSKSEWDKLPEHIRADINKREQEVSDGFKQYSGMKEIMPYVEMAQRSGTTLKAALDSYRGIEQLLIQDFDRGILQIAQNFGQSPQQLVQRLAQNVGVALNNQPSQPADPGSFDPNVLHQYLNPLTQQVTQLQHQLTQQQQVAQAQQQSVINTALERFKSDPAHRYFENVEPLMAQLIGNNIVPRSGDHMADLKAAYEMACYQTPEIRQLLINEQIAKDAEGRKAREKDAAEKARQASRSITGSPSAAVREDTGKRSSTHDDARAAFNEVMARV